ncbi:hypothetical protein ACIPSE_20320 [Streptomyces sp. NPDC090106]|uniref:hypothetical protein n=1 Tax=Streptomyces sp. NPDC090106 TaxID=3365946 RepID=UPI00382BE1CD
MTAGWCSRTVRSAVFAAVCVLLAALGHVLMSGRHVPLRALLLGALLTGAAGWALAGRERGPLAVVAIAVTAQTALHQGFSLAQGGADAHTGAGAGMTSGHLDPAPMHSMASMHSVHSMGPMSSMDMDMGMDAAHMGAGHTGSGSLGMLAAHLLAALLCGVWLAHGERAAFRLLRAVAGWLAAPLRLPLAVPPSAHRPPVRRPRRRSERAPRLLLLVHAITGRGPPVGTAVA